MLTHRPSSSCVEGSRRRGGREGHLVLVAEADSVLGLVEDGAAGGAVDLAVLGAAHLVGELLAGGLLVVGLEAAGGVLVDASVEGVRMGGRVLTERPCRQRR